MENNSEVRMNPIAALFIATGIIFNITAVSVSIGNAVWVHDQVTSIREEWEATKADLENSRGEIFEKTSLISGTIYMSDADYTEEIVVCFEDEQPVLSTYESVPLCSTNTFRCMDYRTITNHASDQWKLQMECYSDPETGIRVYQKGKVRYFCAAMGSAYGQNLGDAFCITLNNGYSFNIVYGDFKNPLGSTEMFYGHPDKNYDEEIGIGLVEFIFDKDVAPSCVLQAGTMSALDQFGGLYGDGGNIASIMYMGEVW